MAGSGGKTRTLFLALDACDPDLVRRYAADGDMPTLARLLTTGTRGAYDNEPGLFVGSVWPTLMTGTPVDKHHWFTGTAFRPAHYDYVNHPLTEPTVWERVSDAGMRVAVFDAPHVEPRQGLNGVQVCEWGCHDRQYGTQSWPPSLVHELDERFGTHPIGTVADGFFDPRHSPCDFVHRTGAHRTAAETKALYDDVVTGIERKTAASLHLLDQGGWDLFYCVYGESHCGGHQFWHLHDPSHPRHDPAALRAIGVDDPLRDLYRRLDAAVAQHLDRLGPDDTALVLLSHGMQAHYDGTHVLPALLHRLSVVWDRGGSPYVGTRTKAAAAALDRLPPPARAAAVWAAAKAARARYGDSPAGREPDSNLPPLPERTFIPIENNTVAGAVRLNLAGREAAGRIPRRDYAAALDWLERRLRELVNVETGEAVVADVGRTDRRYRRRDDDPLPDLIIEWNRTRQIQKVWSPAVGLLEAEYAGARTGDHRPGGLLLATGPGLRPGHMELSPLDVVPIIARSLGLDTPDLEGSVPDRFSTRRIGRRGVGAKGLELLERQARTPRTPSPTTPHDPDVTHHVEGLLHAHHETRRLVHELQRHVEDQRTAGEVLATMSFIKHVEQPPDALVSVVVPTRNRAHRVMRAVESVLGQTYPAVEVLVVDDASDDDTWDRLASIDDPRVRPFRQPARGGTNRARNRGLDEAAGQIVAYLDDDNTFDPDWLKSVVWAFEQYPQHDVLYGARVVDDVKRHHGWPAGGLPWMQLLPWDRDAVKEENRVDINVLAHRRGDARFDETDTATLLGDWDLVLQLTRHGDPLRLPVIAAYYTTDEPTRMSTEDKALMDAQVHKVRAKWRAE